MERLERSWSDDGDRVQYDGLLLFEDKCTRNSRPGSKKTCEKTYSMVYLYRRKVLWLWFGAFYLSGFFDEMETR